MSLTAPVLDYVGSVDMSTESSGTMMYNISFESDISLNTTVLMFEYKIQIPEDDATPETVTLGYVNMEQATFQLGVDEGIWQIAVPASSQYNYDQTSVKIQVRVYLGLNSGIIQVTPWSNELIVRTPPETPVIYNAVYDDDGTTPVLYVTINTIDNPTYNFSNVDFLVAFYYEDRIGNTQWYVSDPTPALDYNSNKLITVPLQGIVSDISGLDVVYVAVYTVFSFGTNFSVSYISNTITARAAASENSPTLDSINYNVYEAEASTSAPQIITANWSAPASGVLTNNPVVHYILNIDFTFDPSASFSTPSIPSTTFTYQIDLSGYSNWTCGETATITVSAIFAQGDTTTSNSLSDDYFHYAGSAVDFIVTDVSYDNTNYTYTGTFSNPTSSVFCVNNVFELSGDGGATQEIGYVAGSNPYSFEFASNLPYGSMTLTLIGTNPNVDNQILAGSSYGTSLSIAGMPVSIAFQYAITTLYPLTYTPSPSQDVVLNWESSVVTQGTLTYYVQQSVDGITYTDIAGPLTTFTYDTDVNGYTCGDIIYYRIQMNLEISGYTITVYSDVESLIVFDTPTAPSVTAYWSASNPLNTFMDLCCSVSANQVLDCFDLSYVRFIVNVLDNNGDPLNYVNGDPATQEISYADISNLIYFNDVVYSSQGTIQAYMQVQNPNTGGYYDGPTESSGYQTSRLPIVSDLAVIDNILSFVVLTSIPLGSGTIVTYNDENHPNVMHPYSLTTTANGILPRTVSSPDRIVVITTLPNGVYRYAFNLLPSALDPALTTYSFNMYVGLNNSVGSAVSDTVHNVV